VVVELFDLGRETPEGLVRIRTLTQENDSRNNVIVVDNRAVFSLGRAAKLAQPDLWALLDPSDVLYSHRRPALGRNDRVFDVLYVLDQANFPNIDLLEAGFDEAAARIYIVVGELLFYLCEAETVGDQLVRVNANLIFARGSAEAGNIHNVGDRL